jgi:serine/threonine-protein kinase
MQCPACKAELPRESRFCSACGAATDSFSELQTDLATPSVAAAARRRSPSSGSIGRLASSGSLEGEGFAPGTVLAERYRVVGLVGRGGMGEVYRADDLKLAQPVALKFLPARLASEPVWIERFYAEVRHARQVAHPNVCRVYDIGEIEGRHFLSMEYVDGEDLASLLRRIGRLPGDKAVEIAREIVAGLAAAHDKGVLHRDLKPANVMLDGRGRARITDFGLAAGIADVEGGVEVSGTPAYMAPEQLAGRGASAQSDLYALGLVLYEIFTGRKAFDAATLAEWRRKHSEEPPTAPSTVTPGLDPTVERVILRCLEKDPKARPRSAAAIAAALPGGDPLAAAIAAGETPSPEMVAAAGGAEGMKPAAALACLTAILAGMALAAYFSPRAQLHGAVPLEKPPDALVEKSREIIRGLGYTDKPLGNAGGFSRNADYLNWVEEHDRSKDRWRDLARGRPAGIYFWYRQSPDRLVPETFSGNDNGEIAVSETDPPPAMSGMVRVRLDPLGRLTRFEAVPSPGMPEGPATPNWLTLFAAAGLDADAFSKANPQWLPPSYADTREAWLETRPERPDRPWRVEAAAWRGRPVYFELAGPWSRPPHAPPARRTAGEERVQILFIAVFSVLLVSGGMIARRNLRLGRSDRQGAMRLAVFVLVCLLLGWAVSTTHVPTASEFGLFALGVSQALFGAVLTWLLYVALEPLIRRRWPDSLIAWTRLLSGRLTDPLIGRVILMGALVGTVAGFAVQVSQILRRAIVTPPPVPPLDWLVTLQGPRPVLDHLLSGPAITMLLAVAFALLFLLIRLLLKKEWLAAAAFLLLWALPTFLAGGWIAGLFGLSISAAFLAVFLRFGLLTLVFGFYFGHFLGFPLTTDSSAWYAGISLFLLLVLAAIAVYGFRTAVAGQPLFSGARLDD